MSDELNPPQEGDGVTGIPSPKRTESSDAVNVARLIQERDHYKAEAERLSATARQRGVEFKKLQVEMNTLKCRHEWERIAKQEGMNPDCIADSILIAGWQPQGEQANEKEIQAKIAELKKSRKYLFKQERSEAPADSGLPPDSELGGQTGPPPNQGQPQQQFPQAPASGKTPAGRPLPQGYTLTDADYRNPLTMMSLNREQFGKRVG